jgi:Ca-activated chloride channel homolog
MDSVDMRPAYIDTAEKVKPKANGETVAETTAGPLVVVSTAPKRQVYVAFSPLQSDFPLQAGFPIFIGNCLNFLVPRESGSGALGVETGKPFSIPAPNENLPLKLTDPGGTDMEIRSGGGSYIVRDAKLVGKYTVQVGNQKRSVYASLRNANESAIAPRQSVLVGGNEVESKGTVLRVIDFWRPFALLALLVLAGEWWLFARRS